ncbi:hypothetical protein HYPSUDRAFT_36986 [Hypholoma sublateritium FD-334 SS-4]|uniref:Uncharacterized protein n=1 Tax=Hypholoma sublateritium (strain FD-334 SS-4) TaxID=945553 RepID=A0A0D2P5D3_HYPSF|nr:hypothetical protein HYPSUDRAFT_36986 [Hypholoma sublateritium FD-334 SS-4]
MYNCRRSGGCLCQPCPTCRAPNPLFPRRQYPGCSHGKSVMSPFWPVPNPPDTIGVIVRCTLYNMPRPDTLERIYHHPYTYNYDTLLFVGDISLLFELEAPRFPRSRFLTC